MRYPMLGTDFGASRMRRSLTVLLAASLGLSACSGWRDSRVNPSNWFGRGVETTTNVEPGGDVNPLLPAQDETIGLFDRPDPEDISVPITRIAELRVERTSTGAIIYAKGIATRQGAYGTQLRRDRSTEEDGILTYRFRVLYPLDATPQGSERSRTVLAAASVTSERLEGIRLIRVVGETNTLESRRR